MSYDKQAQEHGYTAIEFAMRNVQRAFSIGDPLLMWNELKTANTISGKKEIWDPLDKLARQVETERTKLQKEQPLTMADKEMNRYRELQYLYQQSHVYLRELVKLLIQYNLWNANRGPTTRGTGLKQLAEKLEYATP